MKAFMTLVYRLDLGFQVIAGCTLAIMMAVTFTDILVRSFGTPIIGTMEIISFCGAVVIGFAIPYSSWKKSHIYVDFLVEKLPPRPKKIFNGLTRIIGILFFLFVGYNFIRYGMTLIKTGEVSPSFRIPYYPITFGLAASCFLQSLTLVADFLKLFQGETNG